MGGTYRPFQPRVAPRPCSVCTVQIEAKDEALHMVRHHTSESVKKGEILWITPHEAVYGGRHYKPEAQR